MSQTDTKTKILDTAEQLFARDGYQVTSLRALTEQAQVNLAAVNYHFGSKEGLLQAVIERRLLPLDEIRRQKINQILAAAADNGRQPEVRDLLQAFIGPTLEFCNSDAGARDFISLIGRSFSEPDDTVRNFFIRQVQPTFRLLAEGLQLALPHIPPAVLATRLLFTLGSMSQMMASRFRPAQLASIFPAFLNEEQMVAELISFVNAGLEAPC